ncbi:hypothetical protein [Halanaerobium sp. MA284_MarDTE_T2]|uniref:hypothetical protein n=1 Tax=Halanaerobium sp. MA284_MarDTE_T2 TaxID=2183913 RepID=UPI000DF29505|nr:hypothetical protein [Halanaerobium sp. MA284_MarDTE_T2]RCW49747.1 hypothetical protein DFR78_10578 [Halanaerobium sp. MA284_MarDTE_T2]
MKEFISQLKTLYNCGELTKPQLTPEYSNWLQEQHWLVQQSNHLIISDRWLALSWATKNAQDFINHLLLSQPQYQNYLLREVLQAGADIAAAEDRSALTSFISKLPSLATYILGLYQELQDKYQRPPEELEKEEWVEIKAEVTTELTQALDDFVFSDTADYYQKLMRMLQTLQQVKSEPKQLNLNAIDKVNLDNNWAQQRRVTSNPYLEAAEESKYTLVSLKNRFSDPNLELDQEIINNPWGIFLIIFGMVEKQMRAENNDRINLRPAEKATPYQPTEINFLTYLDNGREVYVSSFAELIKDFLTFKDIKLFPKSQLNLIDYFTELLDKEIYIYQNNEYILSDKIDSLLYKKPLLILKNNCSQLKDELKNYIERLAKNYED